VDGYLKKQWEEALFLLASNLKQPAKLCVISSAPNIFAGQNDRGSVDLDTLLRASDFSMSDIRQACENAGIEVNPMGIVESGKPYIQFVEEGMVQVGDFKTTYPIFQEGNLRIERPPIENLIASKLVRASEKDLQDIAFMLKRFAPDEGRIREIISAFPRKQREAASENLVYLNMLGQDK
jgi:hypothetical protein